MATKSGAKSIALISKKKEKLQEKAIRTIKFVHNDAFITSEMKELKILNLKDFITL